MLSTPACQSVGVAKGSTATCIEDEVMPRFRTLCCSLGLMTAVFGTGVFAATAHALTPNPSHIERHPVLGWSSWSAFRFGANAALDEAQARAMVRSGLKAEGFDYI